MQLQNDLPGGIRIVTLALGQMLLLWTLVPLVTAQSSLRRGIFPPSKLRHLPVSITTLGGVAAAGSFIHPAYWILLAASTFSLLPAAFAFGPIGVVSSLLFLLDLVLIAWCIGIFSASRASSSTQLRVSALLSALAPFFVLALLVRGFQGKVSISDSAVSLLAWTPAGWTAAAWKGHDPLAPISLLALVAFFLSRLGASELRRSLASPDASLSSRRRHRRGLPALRFLGRPLGPLVSKELSYLLRNVDVQLCFGISLGATLLFARLDAAYLWIPMLALPLIVSSQLAVWNNPFGLDQRGIDRYRLLPIRGATLLAAKNGAAAAILVAQCLPLAIAMAWRGHALAAVALLLGSVAYVTLLAAIGNQIGVRWPTPREFYHWDNLSQSGGPIAVLVFFAVTGLILGAVALTTTAGEPRVAAGQLVLAIVGTLALRFTRDRAARVYESTASEMRARLSS